MLSLGNARNEEELRAWENRISNLLKRMDITASEISYVTEPKIDGLAISLVYEKGRLVARRHPRRRPDRRGRDPQHPHDGPGPEADRRRPRADRGPGRGLLPAERLRRAERAAHRGGRGGVREPAERGRRHDPPARPQDRRRRVRSRSGRTGSAPARGSSTRRTPRSSIGSATPASRSRARSRRTPASRASSSAAAGGRSGARASTTRSTGWSSRWTSARCGASSAWSGASRAGRSPGSSRR